MRESTLEKSVLCVWNATDASWEVNFSKGTFGNCMRRKKMEKGIKKQGSRLRICTDWSIIDAPANLTPLTLFTVQWTEPVMSQHRAQELCLCWLVWHFSFLLARHWLCNMNLCRGFNFIVPPNLNNEEPHSVPIGGPSLDCGQFHPPSV